MPDYFRLGWARTRRPDLITSSALRDQLVGLDAILVHVSATSEEIPFISQFRIPVYLAGGTASIEQERFASRRDTRSYVKAITGAFFQLTSNTVIIGAEGWPACGETDFYWLDTWLRAIAKHYDQLLLASSDRIGFDESCLESKGSLELILDRFCRDHTHVSVTLLSPGAGAQDANLKLNNLHVRRLRRFLPSVDVLHLASE